MKSKNRISVCGTLFCAFLAVAGSARAQDNPKVEIAGNYTYMHINPGVVNFDCHGGGGSAAWSLNQYLGVVGEFSACKWTGIPPGLNGHTFTYLFGPRLTYRAYGRLEPFGEVLLGGAHQQTYGPGGSSTQSSFAMAIGGGADYKLKPSVAIRFIQADYLYARLGTPTTTHQNNFRLQAGVVFRFGGR